MTLHEQVHVVGHHFEGDDRPVMFGALRTDQVDAPGMYGAGQDLAAVLGAPHDVVPQVICATGANAHRPGHDASIPAAYIYQPVEHVAGMVRNRRLARAVSDAGFGEFRRQVEYKSAWAGGRVIVADRWFASSKTCSECGAVRAKLTLSERTFVCGACGSIMDRDENAALNLAEYGRKVLEQEIAGSGPEIGNGRGADRKTGRARQVAVKRQPGRASAHQTGTVIGQPVTAA